MNNVAIVYSDYYKNISENLVKGIEKNLDNKFVVSKHRVTGAWELIYKINNLIEKEGIDKFIAVGVICKGDTDHYEYLSSGTVKGLIDLTLKKNVYISNCVLNVIDINQAISRSSNDNNKGKESAEALNNLFQ